MTQTKGDIIYFKNKKLYGAGFNKKARECLTIVKES